MKKALVVLLAILLALTGIVSCTQGPDVTEARMIRFDVPDRGNARALDRTPEALDAEALYWKYDAAKSANDTSNLTTGACKGKEIGLGLDSEVGPFSQGYWDFTLYGYTDKDYSNLAWTGKIEGYLLTAATSSNTVMIDVHRIRTVNGSGTIRIPNEFKFEGKPDADTSKMKLEVGIYAAADVERQTNLASKQPVGAEGNTDYSVPSGAYLVSIKYVTEDPRIEWNINEIAVNVYDNIVTTIGGTVDESTKKTHFGTNEKNETVASSESVKVESAAPTVIEVESTPVKSHSTAEETTSVSIPAGGLPTESANASISVTPFDLKAVRGNEEYVVSAGEAVVGAVDIDLFVDGNKQTEISGGNVATVTTYIQTGLGDMANISIKYNGTATGVEPVIKSYDNETGKLEFTTNHFSEYYVVVDGIVAVNTTINKGYRDIELAFAEADHAEIILLADCELNHQGSSFPRDYVELRNVTLDLNGKTLFLKSEFSRLKATGADNTLRIIGSNGGKIIDVGNQKSRANVSAYEGADVIVEGGEYQATAYCFAARTGGSLHISDATCIARYGAIVTNGKEHEYKVIEMNNCKVTGQVGYLAGYGEYSINGGHYETDPAHEEQGCLLYVKAGTLNITDGYFEVHNGNGHLTSKGGGADMSSGDVIIAEAHKSYSEGPTLNITGGTFKPYADTNYDVLILDHADKTVGSVNLAPGINHRRDTIDYVSTYTFPKDEPARFIVDKWDGTSVDKSWYEASSDPEEYVIDSAAGLAGLASLVNDGTDFSKHTIILAMDIDLQNHEWTPIGKAKKASGSLAGTPFTGVFEGMGHEIKGLSITKDPDPSNTDVCIGLFGAAVGYSAEIRNITVTGKIDVQANELGALVVGGLAEGAKVTGCVSNGIVNNNCGAGIVSKMFKTGVVSNCTNNATINGGTKKAGGIVGAGYYDQDLTGQGNREPFEINDCTNTGTVKAASCVGGIVGLAGTVNINNCTNSGDITGNIYGIGGIAGELKFGSEIRSCSNSGVISCVNRGSVKNNYSGVGGIAGWIRYDDHVNYNPNLISKVFDSHNTGEVRGAADGMWGSAGVVGLIYWAAELEGCTNDAPVISTATGSNGAGGVIGSIQIMGDMQEARRLVSVKDCTSTKIPECNGANVNILIGHWDVKKSEKVYADVKVQNCTEQPNLGSFVIK